MFGGGKGGGFRFGILTVTFFPPQQKAQGGGPGRGQDFPGVRDLSPFLSSLQSKLALQKQLTKTLAARFLPSPIPAAAATICALPGPLALRPAPTAATLFPPPILGPALFRAPAGAVRPATGPIVFAPY